MRHRDRGGIEMTGHAGNHDSPGTAGRVGRFLRGHIWLLLMLLTPVVFIVGYRISTPTGIVSAGVWFARCRRQCRRALLARPDRAVDDDVLRIAESANASEEDVRRLWDGLACHYGVPSNKLRSEDRLDVELGGLHNDPDNDTWLRRTSILVGDKSDLTSVPEPLSGEVTLSHLLSSLIRAERVLGTPVVERETAPDGIARYRWSD
jgi:hypothetical protein